MAAAVAGAAFAVRAASWPKVFESGRVIFPGNDAWYHARRILAAARDFPHVLVRDPLLNHPHGGEPIWPPLFDLALAALARVGVDPADAGAVERLIVWVPPLLGALGVALAALVARRLFSPLAGWLAGLGLALLPAAWGYAQLGFVDHHVAVGTFTALLLAVGLGLLGASPRGSLAVAGLGGLAVAAGFAIWPGTLLHLVLLDAALAWAFLARAERGEARALALRIAALHGVAALALAPVAWGRHWDVWGGFSPTVLTSFQPLLLGATALAAATAAASSRGRGERSVEARVGIAVLAACVGIAGFALLASDAGNALEDAWRWLARRESFQAEVAESRPLLVRGGRPTLAPALRDLGLLALAAPLALAWLAVARRDAAGRLLFVFGLGLGIAALAQTRFSNSFAVPLAILAGGALDAAAARWVTRARLRPVAAAALLGVALLPTLPRLNGLWAQARAGLAGRAPELPELEQRQRLLIQVADWLRRETAPPSDPSDPFDPFDPQARPTWGVLSTWTDGHVIEYVAQRPTVVSNFGDDVGAQNMRAAESYYRSAEPAALRLLDELHVRFVVLEQRRLRARRHVAPSAVLPRLLFFDGSEGDRSIRWRSGEMQPVGGYFPAFTGHRLRFETVPKPWQARALPGFQVWERVAGAPVQGRAEPGARVVAELEVETNQGRTFAWRAGAQASSQGRYTLRIPYSTRDAPDGVSVRGAFVRSGSRRAPLAIAEAEVQAGDVVTGPDLRARHAEPPQP